MSRMIDMTNTKHNMLTAIKYSHSDNNGNAYWEFSCDCGNTCIRRAERVRIGSAKNCGCIIYKKEASIFVPYIIGRLQVVQKLDKQKYKTVCDCGNTTSLYPSYIKENKECPDCKIKAINNKLLIYNNSIQKVFDDERKLQRKYNKIKNTKINTFTIVNFVDLSEVNYPIYRVKCDCGNVSKRTILSIRGSIDCGCGNIGVYCIENMINGRKYIGSSKNIMNRWQGHRHHLKSNIHDNIHLQSDYNLHGKDSFKYYLLEKCKVNKLIDREQHYINLYNNNKYNMVNAKYVKNDLNNIKTNEIACINLDTGETF